jgi:hypothetical protein
MNPYSQPHSAIARKVSVKRRYGASMPAVASDRLRRRWMRPASEERSVAMQDATPGLAQCHARLAAMPADFLDWMEDVPPWPANVRERLGAAHDGP